MTPPRVPPWLAPLGVYAADVGLTLAGQPGDYWAGDRSAVREANPLAAALLASHPVAFVAVASLWAAGFVAVVRTGKRWTFVVALLVTLGHAVGVLCWAARYGPAGWVGGLAFLFVLERLWTQSWLTGQSRR